MSKFKSSFPNSAFQEVASPVSGFNLVNKSNSFSSVFDPKPLDEADSMLIENLLLNNVLDENISGGQLEKDIIDLTRLTVEVKAIGKQSIVLLGERVYQVGELLKQYRNGAFTQWIESTFGSRKTGYNMLSYYNLYKSLPDESLREKLKDMPQKTAYILASRKGGDIEVKSEIIRECGGLTHADLVEIIKEKIPAEEKEKRATNVSNEKLIASIRGSVEKLKGCILSEEEREAVGLIVKELSFLSGE